MGKRIIQQARGKGSSTYRVRRKAYSILSRIPKNIQGSGEVIKIKTSAGHLAPLAKIKLNKEIFFIPAFKEMFEGQKFDYLKKEIFKGNILQLKDIPIKTEIYCIESRPFDGGKFVKSGGAFGVVNRKIGEFVYVLMPSKKEKKFNQNCRAIIGRCAGAGRIIKPFLKAGKKHYLKKSKNKLYPRTSAVKMNAIDHPFGSGRGKRPKSKIAKRNAPPGRKVGLIRPRRTGKRK